MARILFIKNILLVLPVVFLIASTLYAQQPFPVPSVPNQLFYLQRTTNSNTIICELNLKNGVLDTKEPVHIFWIKYNEHGQQDELNYMQQKFAYGVKTSFVSKDKYKLYIVSYKKYIMHLMKNTENKYHVYGIINQKQAIVNRIFVKINGGTFYSPKVEYIEVKGVDPVTGKEVMERLKM